MQTQKQKEWYLKNKKLTIQRAREWKKRNPEKVKELGRIYYKKNKEIMNKKATEWQKKNPDKKYAQNVRYVTKNKEKVAEFKRKWVEKNRDKLRIQKALYVEMNRDHVREIFKAWSKKNPYRHYIKIGIPKEIIEAAVRKANGHCQLCGKVARLVVDHCHEKLTFRGLLCQKCNIALGLFNDDTVRLKNAITYLKYAPRSPARFE